MVAMWVARWLYRLYHAWSYASQAFKDSVVGTIAFPITVALCVVLVPASWVIVVAFRALKLFVQLGATMCFHSVCAVVRIVVAVSCSGQVQQQQEQQ